MNASVFAGIGQRLIASVYDGAVVLYPSIKFVRTCIASSLRRGLLNDAEAERYEKTAANLNAAFEISGLGQLIDAGLAADRTVTFAA